MKPFRLIILFFILLSACQKAPQDMVLIPAGEFLLGLDPQKNVPRVMNDRTTSLNAQPQQNYFVDSFYIDVYEVTYEQFLQFKPQAKYKEGKEGDPVRGVDWYEADAYCLWLGKRLPTEFEWEKAARGTDGRSFVWGNEFNRKNSNLGRSVKPPGNFVKDKSPYGVYDMNGNVSEWTASVYESYPKSEFKDENFGKNLKVIRGGSISRIEHGFMEEFALVPYRSFAPPNRRALDTGFRCAG
ncbi:MAG: formylglycine-generating enzyme family protein [Nitrospinales bacterium]